MVCYFEKIFKNLSKMLDINFFMCIIKVKESQTNKIVFDDKVKGG